MPKQTLRTVVRSIIFAFAVRRGAQTLAFSG